MFWRTEDSFWRSSLQFQVVTKLSCCLSLFPEGLGPLVPQPSRWLQLGCLFLQQSARCAAFQRRSAEPSTATPTVLFWRFNKALKWRNKRRRRLYNTHASLLRGRCLHQRLQQAKHPDQRGTSGQGRPHRHRNQWSGEAGPADSVARGSLFWCVLSSSNCLLNPLFRSRRGCSPWKPWRASMLLMTRKCTSPGWSSSAFQLQTTALPGGGGSGTGCWRPDKGPPSHLIGSCAFLTIVHVPLLSS